MIAPWLWPERLFNQLTYPVRQAIRWRRGGYRPPIDDPAPVLASHPQADRLHELCQRYQPALSNRFNAELIVENLDVLHMLDTAKQATDWQAPKQLRALDVGAKHFYYAPALHALWSQQGLLASLVGVELDAFQVYRDGYSRADYAAAFTTGLAGIRYVASDIRDWHEPANAITLLFPFVTPLPLIKWGLPLGQLAPEAILSHVWGLLEPGGLLIIANQEQEEADIQLELCRQLGIPVSAHLHHADPVITDRPERFLTTAIKPR